MDSYPATASERDRWILRHRGPKNRVDPFLPHAFLWEEEFGADASLVSTATLFLSNRECPFRCLMCDLWRNTLDERVPSDAIAMQIRHALGELPPARQIKLYNAGSFFDPGAIPPADDAEIASLVADFERVIVESHPAFLSGRHRDRVLRFRDRIFQNRARGKLEIAMGLESVHPQVLERLNKRMTLDAFREASEFLRQSDIDLRVFLLLRPPFLSEEEGLEWAGRSLAFAADCHASVCAVIPTRDGNGAMEALREEQAYHPPRLRSLETAVERGLALRRFRVFADLWDLEKFFDCECSPRRAARLAHINRTQSIPEDVDCNRCVS